MKKTLENLYRTIIRIERFIFRHTDIELPALRLEWESYVERVQAELDREHTAKYSSAKEI